MPEKIEAQSAESPAMTVFRGEMRDWRLRELEKMSKEDASDYQPDAAFITPDYLNETDLWIWSKIKSDTVTDEDMVKYREKLQEELAHASPEITLSREHFYQLVGNKSLFARINQRRKKEGKPLREREVKDF